MGRKKTIDKPHVSSGAATRHEDIYQVILHNDDHNTMDHVVGALMCVFLHPQGLAIKIMMEAHTRGKAVAEVEGETSARLHRDQLQSYSLTATLEKM
ncbi:MAG: ATP-dependent Clp protease adaptor ClpS [Kiritimatiellae bacterium]|nr:ATP-dependent Clp protease adaptor ClpS [Kiritimatiellia bacterium]